MPQKLAAKGKISLTLFLQSHTVHLTASSSLHHHPSSSIALPPQAISPSVVNKLKPLTASSSSSCSFKRSCFFCQLITMHRRAPISMVLLHLLNLWISLQQYHQGNTRSPILQHSYTTHIVALAININIPKPEIQKCFQVLIALEFLAKCLMWALSPVSKTK